MSRCNINRWGPGTTCERPQNAEAVKEMKAKLEAMQKERAKQDQIWTQPEPEVKSEPKAQSNSNKQLKNTFS